ncbi:MAG: hypothetical protein ACJ8AH_04370 [Stellaceae bacterium]
MDISQYYIPGRVAAAADVFANVLGTALGAMIGSVAYRYVSWLFFRETRQTGSPLLLVGLWLGYRLFPHVPTIDLHKYWDALKPVVLHPSLIAYDLFRHTAIWLAIAALVEAIGGTKRALLLFPLFVGSVLAARILIVGRILGPAELAGAGLALIAWIVLSIGGGPRLRPTLITLLFGAFVIAERLVPFRFTAPPRHFGWIPFHSLIYGSVEVSIMSLLEKAFLYGSLIWLTGKAGLRLGTSIILFTSMLFATSWAETHLAGRSAKSPMRCSRSLWAGSLL